MVVRFPPLDVQGTPWQIHLTLAIDLSFQHSRNDSCARACAARQGASRTALPDDHTHVASGKDLDKLGVGAGREDGVALELGPDRKYVLVVHLAGEGGGGGGTRSYQVSYGYGEGQCTHC